MNPLCLALTMSFVLIGATNARAEGVAARPSSMVSLDVGRLVFSMIPPRTTVIVPLEFESAIGGITTLFVAPRLAFRSGAVGFGISLGIRFYVLNGPPMSGLWMGPEVGALYGATTSSGVSAALAFNVGGGIGYNFVIDDTVVLSPGVNFGVVGLGASTLAFEFSPRLVLGLAF